MKKVIAVLVVFMAVLVNSCSEKGTGAFLKVHDVEVLGSRMFEGALIGCDVGAKEIFARSRDNDVDKFIISVIDIDSPDSFQRVELPIGDSASPTEYALPTHMRRLNDKFCITDGYSKTVVLDRGFNNLFAGMFEYVNFFIEYFQFNDDLMFLAGRPKIGDGERIVLVELYALQKNSRPVLKKTLDAIPLPILDLASNTGKEVQFGPIWPTVRGFEKRGKVYWSWSGQNKYFVYDIAADERRTIELNYLKSKHFTDEEINQLGEYTLGHQKVKLMKRLGRTLRFIGYEGDLYHFGLHDLGPGRVGIIGDLDIAGKKFRLDVIDDRSGEYIKSIQFPGGYRFFREISDKPKGLPTMTFNLDEGLYVWSDIEGEDQDEVIRLTRFNIKE